jgi:ribosomal-protein-alanine N-acetyltransferase
MPGARIKSGERVTLRTFEREDLPFNQRASANPEIRYPIGNPLRNQDQIEEGYEDGNSDQFLVCIEDDAGPGQPDEDDVRRIGVISVNDADWRRPELGYWLVPEVHGEGYGKESVALVIDYVFRVYDHPTVGAGAYDFNKASRGLLESLGFTEEGRIRKDRFIDGEYIDMIQYGLLRKEWRERTQS